MIWWLFGIAILVAMALIYWSEKQKLNRKEPAKAVDIPNIPPLLVGKREKVKLSVNGKTQTGYRAPRPGGDGYYYYDNNGRFIDNSMGLIMMIEILSDYNSTGQYQNQEK